MNEAVKAMGEDIQKLDSDFIDWADQETTSLEPPLTSLAQTIGSEPKKISEIVQNIRNLRDNKEPLPHKKLQSTIRNYLPLRSRITDIVKDLA